jgi:hypothetical protein
MTNVGQLSDGNAPLTDNTKPSNPKAAFGALKWYVSVVSWPVIANMALGMLEGALKYGRHNYRLAGVKASTYVDASVRHIAAFWEGQDLDPDSKIGLHHIDKAMASLHVLRDGILRGTWVDDRPPKSPDNWEALVNDKAKQLIAAFPNPVAPYTQVGGGALNSDPKTNQ